ncbi:MAG TPA: DUF2497 domain-containing protein [Sphingomonadaceae bacterium]|nr:DUF2497 domain-containing protein [Sphingomonadaceae bacterium]
MSDVGQDSSMEDILASIKRVIAEDVRPPAARGVRPRADVDPDEDGDDDDILELDTPLSAADADLVSADAVEATRNSLAALTALRNPPPVADAAALETVVRDMLRPMLKDWLDQRLPGIVTDIVTREVARITGRG